MFGSRQRSGGRIATTAEIGHRAAMIGVPHLGSSSGSQIHGTRVRSLHTEAQEPLDNPDLGTSGARGDTTGGASPQAGGVWIRRAAADDAVGIAALCSEVRLASWLPLSLQAVEEDSLHRLP